VSNLISGTVRDRRVLLLVSHKYKWEALCKVNFAHSTFYFFTRSVRQVMEVLLSFHALTYETCMRGKWTLNDDDDDDDDDD